MAQAPFDQPRQALVPRAGRCRCGRACRRPRLAAWAPDGDAAGLGARAPGRSSGSTPTRRRRRDSRCCSTASTSRTGWRSRARRSTSPRATRSTRTTTPTGAATNRRTVAAGLPDARSPDLRGAYAHALKSVAVGPDGAVYFSIGSTGNISADDRTADPAARHDHAGAAGRRARPSRSRPACATAPGWPSPPTARCGPRSTTATTSPIPRTGYGVDARLRQRPPAGAARPADARVANWAGPTAIPTAAPPNLPFDPRRADQRRRRASSTAPRCRRSSRAWARTPRRWGMSFVDGALPAPYAQGALVGVHGSWNRQPPRAPEVSFFPWQRRRSRRPADPGRRLPGRRRLALGPAGRRGRRARTARSTSPTTTPTRSTGWRRRPGRADSARSLSTAVSCCSVSPASFSNAELHRRPRRRPARS